MENNDSKPQIHFTPVVLRARHDGWTAEKQIAFIEALAETGIVEDACRRVGMSDTSARALRHRPSGMSFRKAWEAAVDYSSHLIEEEANLRSRRGVARPIFYKGEQVGEYRHFDERLTMFLLRTRRCERYGKWIEQTFEPAPEDCEIDHPDAAIRLDGCIERIEWQAHQDSEDEGNEPQ